MSRGCLVNVVCSRWQRVGADGLSAHRDGLPPCTWRMPLFETLAHARKLIEAHGYGRRLEELVDAERLLR